MRLLLLSLMALVLLAETAQAHRIVASGYMAGERIEGDIAFSNGEAAAHALVEVFDPTGRKLGEATTDADGFFTYTPTEQVPHIFRADLGSGHVGEFRIDLGEVPEAPAPAPFAPSLTLTEGDTAALQALIAETVRTEMRPLRAELIAQRETVKLQQILGGLGYIAGLFGLGFYLAARHKFKRPPL